MSSGIRKAPRKVPNDLQGCSGCPLEGLDHHNGPVPSFAYGSHKNYDLFILAEAPGLTDDEKAEPMVGSAGDIQWSMLDYFGLENVAIGNTTCCWPGQGNPEPDPKVIQHCLGHVKRDILRLKPKALLLAGKTAAQSMLKSKLSLGKLRGWHRIRLSNDFAVDAYVTNHPSSVHYDPDKKSTIESDLLRVVRRIKGEDEVALNYSLAYLTTRQKVERAVDITLDLPDGTFVGHDWENLDLRLVNALPLCLAWGYLVKPDGQSPYYRCFGVPLKHPDTPFSGQDFPQVMAHLQRMFRGIRKRHREGSMLLGAHGAKFENAIARDVLGVVLPQIVCTIQCAHAVDENRLKGGFGGGGKSGKGSRTRRGIFDLATLSSDWLAIDSEFWDKGTAYLIYSGQGDKTDVKQCTDHCARDVAAHVALWHEIGRKADQESFDLNRIRPLLESTPYLLGTIERNGMPVDINTLAELRADKGPLVARMDIIEKELHTRPAIQDTITKLRGGTNVVPIFAKKGHRRGFDIRKRKYLATLFYEVLDLPWGDEKEQQTKTGLAKIDKEFFSFFKDIPEVALVSEWKQLDKLVSTYIEGWWRLVEASPDGRIRASFNAAGTTTGRLSCSRPNLQQIPRGKTESAKILKKVFRPHCNPGDSDLRLIVSCDLSQAEVRWLAEVSNEPVLRDMYIKRAEFLEQYALHPSKDLKTKIKQECDLHRSTGSEMFGVPILEVTDNQRAGAKAINFGNIYGQTAMGLAALLGVPVDEAEALLTKWLSRFKRAGEWFIEIENFAKEHGYVESPIGRRRHLDALLLGDIIKRGSALGHLLRVARNAPIQSIASDMTLWVAIKVQQWIDTKKKNWKLMALVHDSIIAEIPIDEALEYVKIAKTIAESPTLLKDFGVAKLTVPQEMEFSVGLNYGEVTDLTTSRLEQEQVIQSIWDRWRQTATA
jgi:uracil-DNA glycosylase family 4